MTSPEEVSVTAALQMPSLLDDKQDWTVDDLANLPKDLRYELIDGRLILPSATQLHQDISIELVNAIRVNCPSGYRVVFDISLRIDRRNEPRPDVVVRPLSSGMRSPAPINGALLLVEVVSPTSRPRDTHAKAKLFAEAGVKHYWVVDPVFEGGVVLTEFQIGDTGRFDIATSTNKIFTTDVPFPITVDVPALTALREAYRRADDEL
jgi:Uma2 family endonuclease